MTCDSPWRKTRIREGSKQLFLDTSASGRQSRFSSQFELRHHVFISVLYVSTRRDTASRRFITNPVVGLEAYGQTSLDRHVHVGHAECLEHEMRHVLQDGHGVHQCDWQQDDKRTFAGA